MAERSERWVVNVFAVLGFGATLLTLGILVSYLLGIGPGGNLVITPAETARVRAADLQTTVRAWQQLRDRTREGYVWGTLQDSGDSNRRAASGVAESPVGCAHSGQNFAVGDSVRPHFAHARASGAAHSSQNFAPASFRAGTADTASRGLRCRKVSTGRRRQVPHLLRL